MNKTENLEDYRQFLNKIYFDILDSTYKEFIEQAGFKREECIKGIDEKYWMEAYNFLYVPMMKTQKMFRNNAKPFNPSLKEDLKFLNRKMNMVKEGIGFILSKEFGIVVGWVNSKTGKCEFVG